MTSMENAFDNAGYTQPKSALENNMENAIAQMKEEDGPTAERLTVGYANDASGNINDSVAPDSVDETAEVDLTFEIMRHLIAAHTLMDEYIIGDLDGEDLADACRFPVGKREFEQRDCSYTVSKYIDQIARFTHYNLTSTRKALETNGKWINRLKRDQVNDFGKSDDELLTANKRQMLYIKQFTLLDSLDARVKTQYEHLTGSPWAEYKPSVDVPTTTAASIESDALLAKTAALLK